VYFFGDLGGGGGVVVIWHGSIVNSCHYIKTSLSLSISISPLSDLYGGGRL